MDIKYKIFQLENSIRKFQMFPVYESSNWKPQTIAKNKRDEKFEKKAKEYFEQLDSLQQEYVIKKYPQSVFYAQMFKIYTAGGIQYQSKEFELLKKINVIATHGPVKETTAYITNHPQDNNRFLICINARFMEAQSVNYDNLTTDTFTFAFWHELFHAILGHMLGRGEDTKYYDSLLPPPPSKKGENDEYRIWRIAQNKHRLINIAMDLEVNEAVEKATRLKTPTFGVSYDLFVFRPYFYSKRNNTWKENLKDIVEISKIDNKFKEEVEKLLFDPMRFSQFSPPPQLGQGKGGSSGGSATTSQDGGGDSSQNQNQNQQNQGDSNQSQDPNQPQQDQDQGQGGSGSGTGQDPNQQQQNQDPNQKGTGSGSGQDPNQQHSQGPNQKGSGSGSGQGPNQQQQKQNKGQGGAGSSNQTQNQQQQSQQGAGGQTQSTPSGQGGTNGKPYITDGGLIITPPSTPANFPQKGGELLKDFFEKKGVLKRQKSKYSGQDVGDQKRTTGAGGKSSEFVDAGIETGKALDQREAAKKFLMMVNDMIQEIQNKSIVTVQKQDYDITSSRVLAINQLLKQQGKKPTVLKKTKETQLIKPLFVLMDVSGSVTSARSFISAGEKIDIKSEDGDVREYTKSLVHDVIDIIRTINKDIQVILVPFSSGAILDQIAIYGVGSKIPYMIFNGGANDIAQSFSDIFGGLEPKNTNSKSNEFLTKILLHAVTIAPGETKKSEDIINKRPQTDRVGNMLVDPDTIKREILKDAPVLIVSDMDDSLFLAGSNSFDKMMKELFGNKELNIYFASINSVSNYKDLFLRASNNKNIIVYDFARLKKYKQGNVRDFKDLKESIIRNIKLRKSLLTIEKIKLTKNK